MNHTHSKKGYSLVEVLVAIAILMLSIIGPITIAAKSLQSAQYARQQNTAFFLAQEGITAINTLRNNAAVAALRDNPQGNPWAWTSHASLAPCFSGGCNIDFRDETLLNNIVDCDDSANACTLRYDEEANRAVYQLVQGEETPYRRIITLAFDGTGNDELIVESTVEWNSSLLGETREVKLGTSLFNLFK